MCPMFEISPDVAYPYDIYMDTLLSRVLYISYRNLLVIDSAGAKWMNTFANQWLSLLKL